jgi:hypothetical protein
VVAGDTASTRRRRAGLAAMLAGEASASAVAELPDQAGAALEHRLDLLRQVIVPERVARALGRATTAIVVPDGALHLVPFEALVLAPRSKGRGARFWLDDGPAVRYVSSSSSWLALEARHAAQAGGGAITPALSVSDPDFARRAPSSWAALPATRRETEALVAALKPPPSPCSKAIRPPRRRCGSSCRTRDCCTSRPTASSRRARATSWRV